MPHDHKDCIGQNITVGAKVLWSNYGGNSGFSGTFEVVSLSAKRVRIENPKTGHRSTVDPKAVIVIDINLERLKGDEHGSRDRQLNL